MPKTWSASRDQALVTCERRYFYRYLAPARINSKDPALKEIAFLKKLKTKAMWQGELFHTLVNEFCRLILQGNDIEPVTLIPSLERRARQEWAFSEGLAFRASARDIDRPGGLALLEHEYGNPLNVSDESEVIREVVLWVNTFNAWVRESRLVESLRNASKTWIEPPTFGRFAPGFHLDGVQVLAKVDLAIRTNDGQFQIFDWKTGNHRMASPGTLTHSEFQIAVYYLWPHLSLGHPLNSIEARLVYIGTESVYSDTIRVDDNLREFYLVTKISHFGIFGI